MIAVLLFFNFAFMLLMPILLGIWIHRRWGPSWRLYFIGVATFIGSQVFHIPFNWLVLNKLKLLPTDTAVLVNLIVVAVFLGLSAGVFEEVARYLAYRFWAKDARSWSQGMMMGAGHGGVEAILLGVIGWLNFVILLGLSQGAFQELIPAEQMGLVSEQIEAMFGIPWYMALLGAVERAFALCLHLAFSVMVLQVFVRKNILWLVAAIGWHALVDATAVFAISTWDALITELLIGILALASIGIIYKLYTPNPVEPELEPLPEVGQVTIKPALLSAEAIEKSKYS